MSGHSINTVLFICVIQDLNSPFVSTSDNTQGLRVILCNSLPCNHLPLHPRCFKPTSVVAETRDFQNHHRKACSGGTPRQIGAKVKKRSCFLFTHPINVNMKTVYGFVFPVLMAGQANAGVPLSLTNNRDFLSAQLGGSRRPRYPPSPRLVAKTGSEKYFTGFPLPGLRGYL